MKIQNMKIQKRHSFLAIVFCCGLAFAQVPRPTGSIPPNPARASENLAQPLAQLDQASRQTVMDLGRVRVEKWKTDGSVKDQARGNIESLQKNLTSALPALMEQVQTNPSHVGAVVKLYRNLNVVYDVLSSVAESTGAFGSKDDYQALATDVGNLDTVRRNIADQLEQMASAQDAAYAQMVNQARAQQRAAAEAATPPKKVIVDDEAPVKKATAKKKKKPAADATASDATKSQ
jgi:hypothetical protein